MRPVVDELRRRATMHVTEIVAALLRVCRAHAAYIDQHKTEPGVHRPLLALEARLRARFEAWRRPRWVASRLNELAGELERACVEAPAALVAWQASRWLERRSARHLVGFFAGVDRQVASGDAWPIVESPAHCYDVPTGNPASRGRAADRGEWLTLVPDDTAGVDVRLRWCGAWLPSVKRGTRIAVGVLARSPLLHGLLSGRWTEYRQFADDDHRRARWTNKALTIRVREVNPLRFLVKDDVRSMTSASLRFVLANPAVSCALLGARRPVQITNANELVGTAPYLPPEDLVRVAELTK